MDALNHARRALGRAERAIALDAVRALVGLVGARGAAGVLATWVRERWRGEPFDRVLGQARDARDALSRRQVADLVLVYRALLPRVGREAAFRYAQRLVERGGAAFLQGAVPRALPLGADVDAVAGVRDLAARFFNMTARVEAVPGTRGVAVTVERCRFVELLAAAGAPELVPLLCATDLAFFDGVNRPVRLRRSLTLARDGRPCDFVFEPVPAE